MLRWLPYAVLCAGTAALLAAILALNGGRLSYTLDDPYIHLAVAENIARGGYGVNPGELSAPASSILYPLLFVPFARLAVVEWLPLAFGFASAVATIWLWSRVVTTSLGTTGARARDVAATAGSEVRAMAGVATAVLVTLLIPATNLIGVMFTGMEHSLQLFGTALLLAGLVRERERGTAPWWLWAAIVLGPLLRYENLAVSVPAIVYLFVGGHRAMAAAMLVVLLALLGAFSAFLSASGLGLLPTSVMLKSGAVSSGGSVSALLGAFLRNLFLRQGALLALMVVLLGAAAFGAEERRDRSFALWAAAAVLLHLLVGGFGWFDRYELYIWMTALLSLIVVFARPLRRLIATTRMPLLLAGAAGITLAIAYPYIYTTLKTPLGSNNIYEQQYQMHRFVTQYYRGPVAVTDLGWVAFRNEQYVLDLWGLAHRRAAEARTRGDASYMSDLAREYDVKLAMLYDAWYTPAPEGWTPVAQMRLSRQKLTPAEDAVTFYVLDRGAEPRVRALLREFAATLPPEVRFTMLD
jgi:hypothetical protein